MKISLLLPTLSILQYRPLDDTTQHIKRWEGNGLEMLIVFHDPLWQKLFTDEMSWFYYYSYSWLCGNNWKRAFQGAISIEDINDHNNWIHGWWIY